MAIIKNYEMSEFVFCIKNIINLIAQREAVTSSFLSGIVMDYHGLPNITFVYLFI